MEKSVFFILPVEKEKKDVILCFMFFYSFSKEEFFLWRSVYFFSS